MSDPQEIREDGAVEQVADAAEAGGDNETVPRGDAGTAPPHPDDAETVPGEAETVPGGDAETAPSHPDDGRSREALLDALAEAERSREEYVDHLRRERAEFDNYRKRSSRERLEALDRGAEQVVTNLLGVLDNFALALDAADASEDDALRKGVQMVHNELVGVLTNAGLEEIPGQGLPFDPEQHEAMMQVEAEAELGHEVDEPVVAEVLRRGYRFKGRVLRPASVKVAR